MSRVRYLWWPISFGYVRDSQTLWQWIVRAIDSRRWTLDYPHKCSDAGALEIHKAACLRMWHGWPSGNAYGWTLHIGKFKVYFGNRRNG